MNLSKTILIAIIASNVYAPTAPIHANQDPGKRERSRTPPAHGSANEANTHASATAQQCEQQCAAAIVTPSTTVGGDSVSPHTDSELDSCDVNTEHTLHANTVNSLSIRDVLYDLLIHQELQSVLWFNQSKAPDDTVLRYASAIPLLGRQEILLKIQQRTGDFIIWNTKTGSAVVASLDKIRFLFSLATDESMVKLEQNLTTLQHHLNNPSAPLPEGFEWIGGKVPHSKSAPTAATGAQPRATTSTANPTNARIQELESKIAVSAAEITNLKIERDTAQAKLAAYEDAKCQFESGKGQGQACPACGHQH